MTKKVVHVHILHIKYVLKIRFIYHPSYVTVLLKYPNTPENVLHFPFTTYTFGNFSMRHRPRRAVKPASAFTRAEAFEWLMQTTNPSHLLCIVLTLTVSITP